MFNEKEYIEECLHSGLNSDDNLKHMEVLPIYDMTRDRISCIHFLAKSTSCKN